MSTRCIVLNYAMKKVDCNMHVLLLKLIFGDFPIQAAYLWLVLIFPPISCKTDGLLHDTWVLQQHTVKTLFWSQWQSCKLLDLPPSLDTICPIGSYYWRLDNSYFWDYWYHRIHETDPIIWKTKSKKSAIFILTSQPHSPFPTSYVLWDSRGKILRHNLRLVPLLA